MYIVLNIYEYLVEYEERLINFWTFHTLCKVDFPQKSKKLKKKKFY